jgi:type I restriction enzyme S subunit
VNVNGWKRRPLGELAELRGRIGWRGLTAKEYKKEGPLFLSVHSLNYGDYVDFRDAFHITPQRYNESPEIMLQEGDVLICKDGAGIGKVGIVGELPGETTINSSLLMIRSGKEILPKFLYHCLCSPYFQAIVQSRLQGATTPHLYQRDITEFPVVLPPLPEQQRIVGILDEAFAGIATAKANTEKNLRNARELFESELRAVFAYEGDVTVLSDVCEISSSLVDPRESNFIDLPHVGGANIETKTGVLIDLKTAREEGLKSGKFVFDQSTVLYSKIRPYLMKVARPDFRGLCSADIYPLVPKQGVLDRGYLFHLLLSPSFTAYAIKGSARAGMPKVNREHLFAFRVSLPSITIQRRQAAQLDALAEETQRLESLYQQKLAALDALKKSLLHQAFSGQLKGAGAVNQSSSAPSLLRIAGISTTDLHAAVLAMAYRLHEKRGNVREFGHVKAEKTAHMFEAHLGIDLGRHALKDAAGPNDFVHLRKVEHRAKMKKWFCFEKAESGAYRFQKLDRMNKVVSQAELMLGSLLPKVEKLLNWMLPMTWQQAEIVATVYAAWNNLLLDGKKPSDEEIVYESRENWHPEKLKIERWRFFEAVKWLRNEGVTPQGKGARVEKRG